LRELIATKIAGKEVVSPVAGEQPQGDNIIDLMEALKASIEQNKSKAPAGRAKKEKGA